MDQQLIFLSVLYLIGILCVLPLRGRIPIAFIGISGFLWGMLFWIGCNLLWLMVTQGPAMAGSLLVGAGFLIIILGLNAHQRTWRMKRKELLWCVLPWLIFVGFGVFVSSFNYSQSSNDTFSQLFLANSLAREGITDFTSVALLSWGPGLPFLHIANTWLQIDYMYILQPMTAYHFLTVWGYLVYKILSVKSGNARSSFLLAGLLSIMLFSSWGFVFQYTYIHNSLHSAVYLFTAVATLWLGLETKNNSWFIVSVLALVGFCLFRREASLMAILFLSVFLSIRALPLRLRAVVALIPIGLSFIFIAWVWLINQGMESEGIFSSSSALLQMLGLLAFMGFVGAVWFEIPFVSWLVPHIPKIMVLGLGLAMIGSLVWNTDFMFFSFRATIHHLFLSSWWSFTTVSLTALIILSFRHQVPYAEFFTYSIPAFFLLALLVRTSHSDPYQFRVLDSLNRMITYIIPLLLLYSGLKFIALLDVTLPINSKPSVSQTEETTR